MSATTVHTAIVDAMQTLAQRGLNSGASGNISVRRPGGFAITPTGIDAAALQAEQIVELLDGEPDQAPRPATPGQLKPSSEWHFHAAVYRARPDINAVVHCHSHYATALACNRLPIPAFHYMVAAAGGREIPLADYALFGSAELARHIVSTLGDSYRACLLANHGQLAAGPDLASALQTALLVESLAGQYCTARQCGEPVLLEAAAMDAVRARFADYGNQPALDP